MVQDVNNERQVNIFGSLEWPYYPTGIYERFVESRICDIRDTFIRVDENMPDADAKDIVRILKYFSDPALERFISGRTFKIVANDEYERLPDELAFAFSPKMGVKIDGTVWYLRRDLFETQRRARLTAVVWYAAGAVIGSELEGVEGFDRSRFQAELNRYLAARVKSIVVEPWAVPGFFLSGVDPEYQAFFDKVLETGDFRRDALRRAFIEAREEYRRSRKPAGYKKRFMSARRNTWQVVDMTKKKYEELVDQGVNWELDNENNLNLSLQNASSRERVESSHRLNFHYYNSKLNSDAADTLSRALGSSNTDVLIAPGLVGAYENTRPGEEKGAALLVGLLFDAGIEENTGTWGAHSYIGVPITVKKGGTVDYATEDLVGYPEWELGIQRSNDLFIGAMMTVPFGREDNKYLGVVVRGEI